MSMDMSAILAALEEFVTTVAPQKISQEMTNVVQDIYLASQSDVPVLSGGLKDSGAISVDTSDPSNMTFEVSYCDGTSTPTQYTYPGVADPADGYAWFVELGTVHAPAQPYLGPHFDMESQNIEKRLENLF